MNFEVPRPMFFQEDLLHRRPSERAMLYEGNPLLGVCNFVCVVGFLLPTSDLAGETEPQPSSERG